MALMGLRQADAQAFLPAHESSMCHLNMVEFVLTVVRRLFSTRLLGCIGPQESKCNYSHTTCGIQDSALSSNNLCCPGIS